MGSSSKLMDHLRKMHSLELNTSLGLFTHITITMMNNCSDLLTTTNRCEVYTYQADCLYTNNEFKNAQIMYEKALQALKSASRSKVRHGLLNLQQNMSDVDIKYKIYLCCLALNNEYEALSVLESVPQKSRPPKISYALAKLYQKLNMETSAISNYKEVLKVCPLAIDCAIELMRLGEHPNVVINILNIHSLLEWVVPYIKAHGTKISKDFKKSVSLFEALNKQTSLTGNPSIMCDLAKALYFSGDSTGAMQYFKACHLQDPQWLQGMDLYGFLLCKEEQYDELDKLSNSLFSISQLHPEPWVVMGYHAKSKGDYSKAVYLAAKAADLNPTCIQALLLKGVSLRMLGEAKIAVTHFRQAINLAPTRLDCYAGLVNCYIHEHRNHEAINIAKAAIDAIGYTPDSLVLCAATHLRNSAHDQATRLVDRALTIKPKHKEALEIKCIIAQRQENYPEAIKILLDAIQIYSSSNFHTILASCYVKTAKYAEAVDHLHIALCLNANNKEAKDSLEKIKVINQNANVYNGDQSADVQNSNLSDDHIVNAVSWPHDDWF